ncbi:hypothetical protein DPMN_019141 [Dreissena polymorpha]|uniref:Uncharacterized protein n=1 Tax=Dreissena polymorpha TaxID=45954 RepID=A0A9D4NHT5_DREPO|nr:hypothetical protein DPMN_019141 [Dreissena polymorpha]
MLKLAQTDRPTDRPATDRPTERPTDRAKTICTPLLYRNDSAYFASGHLPPSAYFRKYDHVKSHAALELQFALLKGTNPKTSPDLSNQLRHELNRIHLQPPSGREEAPPECT